MAKTPRAEKLSEARPEIKGRDQGRQLALIGSISTPARIFVWQEHYRSRNNRANSILKRFQQPAFAASLKAAAAASARIAVSRGVGYEHRSKRHHSRLAVTEEVGGFPFWKRALDITLILLTLPIWLPLMTCITLWVKAVSRGPVFYRQQRIGFRGACFLIFKFRTMRVNAETRTHEDYFASLMRSEAPMTKLDAAGDPRLIPGARFLRASGLDELPQIFNVLRGDMSLVGPRPCLPCEFNRYEQWQQRRVNAPPGLTGYWQVNGKNETTFNQMMFMDLFYIDKMSIWFDLGVILKTIPVLLFETIEALKRYRSRHTSHSVRSIPQSIPAISSHNGAHQSSRNGAPPK